MSVCSHTFLSPHAVSSIRSCDYLSASRHQGKRCDLESKNWVCFFVGVIYLFIFREGKGGRKRRRGTSMCGCLSRTHPLLGTWPETQACALTGNRTSDPLVHRLHSVHWATPAGAWVWFLLCALPIHAASNWGSLGLCSDKRLTRLASDCNKSKK